MEIGIYCTSQATTKEEAEKDAELYKLEAEAIRQLLHKLEGDNNENKD